MIFLDGIFQKEAQFWYKINLGHSYAAQKIQFTKPVCSEGKHSIYCRCQTRENKQFLLKASASQMIFREVFKEHLGEGMQEHDFFWLVVGDDVVDDLGLLLNHVPQFCQIGSLYLCLAGSHHTNTKCGGPLFLKNNSVFSEIIPPWEGTRTFLSLNYCFFCFPLFLLSLTPNQ